MEYIGFVLDVLDPHEVPVSLTPKFKGTLLQALGTCSNQIHSVICTSGTACEKIVTRGLDPPRGTVAPGAYISQHGHHGTLFFGTFGHHGGSSATLGNEQIFVTPDMIDDWLCIVNLLYAHGQGVVVSKFEWGPWVWLVKLPL